MADIFISYARSTAVQAQQIADALRARIAAQLIKCADQSDKPALSARREAPCHLAEIAR